MVWTQRVRPAVLGRSTFQIVERITVQSVHKAIDLMLFVAGRSGPVGVTEVAEHLHLPKTSAHRLLQALTHRNLLEHTRTGRYEPGLGMLLLNPSGLNASPLIRTADPALRTLAATLGETFFLVMRRGDELVVVHKAEGSGFLRASPSVGATIPLHATAAGRIYLAFAADVRAPEPFHVYTRHTPTNAARLQRLVEQAHRDQCAVSVDEWQEGLSAVAAPILCRGRLLAAVTVACASVRFRQLGERQLTSAIWNVAKSLSATLEGTQS